MTKRFFRIKTIFTLFIFLACSACAFIYEQDVQQGNVVNDEMLNKLERGMSKTEVQFYIGTPLVEDPFHANRWDYFYTYHEGGEDKREHRIITLRFDDQNRLAEITGSAQTAEQQAADVSLPGGGDLNTVISDIDQEDENDEGFWASMKRKILQ